jgi:predicted nucleic acid-binding Zn ribbon protein
MATLYSGLSSIYKAHYYCLRCGARIGAKARFCADCALIVKEKDARDDRELPQDSGE